MVFRPNHPLHGSVDSQVALALEALFFLSLFQWNSLLHFIGLLGRRMNGPERRSEEKAFDVYLFE